MERIRIQDRYNPIKSWEVTFLKGGFYLKQFIGDRQHMKGLRTTKKWIEHILDVDLNELREQAREGK